MAKIVNVLATANCYSASVTGIIDMLESANKAAQYLWQVDEKPIEWRLVTLDGEPVICSNKLVIGGQQKISPPPPASANRHFTPETLIIAAPVMQTFGGIHSFVREQQKTIGWLEKNHHLYSQIVTHCTGTLFLAELGLLNGNQATTSWWIEKSFRKHYPEVNLTTSERVVKNDRFLLGGATICFREMIMVLIEQICGAEVARLLSKFMLMEKSHTNQMLFAFDLPQKIENPVVKRAQKWIIKNLDKNISVAEVANEAAVTTRTLARHFQKDFGYSPQVHIQKLRIEKCKALLESTSLKLVDIARRCGYSDESAFRRLFKKHCDVSPMEFRKMFQSV